MDRQAILVTGSEGFIGRNLTLVMRRMNGLHVLEHDVGNKPEELKESLKTCDVVIHLAGINRPKDNGEFMSGNAGSVSDVCDELHRLGRKPTLILSSSTQADLSNPYGASKKAAEDRVFRFAEEVGARVAVFRLPNVFGKWSRPNYNTVVATFCHNVARGEPLTVNDPEHEITFVYIDDVVRCFLDVAGGGSGESDGRFYKVEPELKIRLGDLAVLIESFREVRERSLLPNLVDPLSRHLYSTYLSFLPPESLSYDLVKHEDQRGVLAELLKAPGAGQIFFSVTKPGVVRGNHYHDSKVEKFFVLHGDAKIRLQHLVSGEITETIVSGEDLRVVDIPPGLTHNIENIGSSDLVVLFWASELFDPDRPDTYFQEVGLE